jgi:aerobic C4-dicarboxylate transport protein
MAATDVSMAGQLRLRARIVRLDCSFIVVAALVLGHLTSWHPQTAQSLKFFSDAFLRLIAMVVAPIVFCVVVHGIASAGDLRKVGRVGVKSLVYFEGMTRSRWPSAWCWRWSSAPATAWTSTSPSSDAKQLASFADNAHKLQGGGFGGFILNIIPPTAFDAFARNDVLQVLFFAVIFGVSLALVGEPGKPVVDLIESIAKVLFKAMGLIVRVAPLGVLGAIGFTVGKYGVGSLKQLLALVVLFYVAVALFVVIALGLVMRMAGLSLFKFLRYLKEELLIVLATASSDSVLPQIMRKLEAMGVKQEVVGLVIPTGYSFNLDAFSIYLTLAVVFIAQRPTRRCRSATSCWCSACRWSRRRARMACRARRSSSLPRRLARSRPSLPSVSCWCCRSTGSSASRALSAI